MSDDLVPDYQGRFDTVPGLGIVTLDEFADVEEPGAEALIGGDGEALIPEDGDVMLYGDGAGKTTLAIDLAFHAAAGDPWLGIPVPRPLRVLLVENEGPRPLFRAKLRRKRDAWAGSPVGDRLLVVDAPWARLSLDDERCCDDLASAIHEHEIDLVVCGPVTRSGMSEAGTLQQVRDFMGLIGGVRLLAGRRVAFVLIHHENKGGQVSGAWEGAGDTLLHLSAQGHGRARLHVQKARWSTGHHQTTVQLLWADGEGFDVEDKPGERDLAGEILDLLARRQWLTAKEVGAPTKDGGIGANVDSVKEALARLVNEARVIEQKGPPGRSPNAVCYLLPATDSGAPSQSSQLPTADSTLPSQYRPADVEDGGW